VSNHRWIVIPGWDRFQHYQDRNPTWLKTYVELLHDEAYLGLTLSARGLLHGLWLEYAASRGQLPGDTARLSRRLRVKVLSTTLESLSEAGFSEIVASKPLAHTRSREKRREEKTPPQPPLVENEGGLEASPTTNGPGPTLTKRELSKFTGCRYVRGTHGATYVADPLGQDRPPSNWPHARPTREQVQTALMEVGTT
jgi:hypothetical protein